MEDMHRIRCRRPACEEQSFHALTWNQAQPSPGIKAYQCGTRKLHLALGSSIFLGVSSNRHNWLNHCLIIKLSPASSRPKMLGLGDQSSKPLVTWLGPLTTSPHYQVLSKSHQYHNTISSILNFQLWWKGVCYEQQETHSTFMKLKQFQELRTRDQVLWQKMLLLLRKF